MAIRKKLNHDDRTREKIRTSQLINRLTKHILGTSGGDDEMSPSQVTAALGLIKKTLPDLAATHNTTDEGKTFEEWLDEISDEPETPDK